jgi:hypothetical protein
MVRRDMMTRLIAASTEPQSPVQKAFIDRFIADVHEEVSTQTGTDPSDLSVDRLRCGVADRVERVLKIPSLENAESLVTDLTGLSRVLATVAVQLGSPVNGGLSNAFLHNTNHDDRAYTPENVCSGRAYVKENRRALSCQPELTARLIDPEACRIMDELRQSVDDDMAIETLHQILMQSVLFGPLDDDRSIRGYHLSWRLDILRNQMADRVTKVCDTVPTMQDRLQEVLPASRTTDWLFGE